MTERDEQLDLDFTRRQPKCGVGYKERSGASQEAAEDMAESGRANRLRMKVRAYFEAGAVATADECAHALNEGILSIRPRVSELRNAGVLMPTGERRRSDGGKNASVWKWAKAA